MLYNLLFDWQKNIVNKLENKNRYGLFLDMGVGKTPISLALAEKHKSNKIIIISIDKKARETIDEEGSFLYWASKMDIQYNMYTKKYSFNEQGPKKYQAKISSFTNDIFIINYESLYKRTKNEENHKKCELKENITDFIVSCKNTNTTVIIDESHKIKELDSLQTKAINKLIKYLSLYVNDLYIYLLTGTPFTQGFIDLYSQLKILGWEGNKSLFVDAFCIKGNVPGLMGWQQPIVGYKNEEKLYELVHKFAITMKSSDVVILPEQIFIYHTLDSSNEMKLYTQEKLKRNEIEEELKKRNIKYELEISKKDGKINNPFYRNIAFPDLNWVAETISSFWLRARQLSIGFQGNSEYAKWFNKNRLNKLKELLENNPNNYILFYNFTPELLEIYDICDELGYNIDIYCGEIKSLFYYNKYSKQSNEERLVNTKNIIIANYASGSTGANWQLYNKCILFSVPLFKDYQQGIKRVHRIGQKSTVFYHVFYENNWLDNSMLFSLKESKEYDKNLFESDLKAIQNIMDK